MRDVTNFFLWAIILGTTRPYSPKVKGTIFFPVLCLASLERSTYSYRLDAKGCDGFIGEVEKKKETRQQWEHTPMILIPRCNLFWFNSSPDPLEVGLCTGTDASSLQLISLISLLQRLVSRRYQWTWWVIVWRYPLLTLDRGKLNTGKKIDLDFGVHSPYRPTVLQLFSLHLSQLAFALFFINPPYFFSPFVPLAWKQDLMHFEASFGRWMMNRLIMLTEECSFSHMASNFLFLKIKKN